MPTKQVSSTELCDVTDVDDVPLPGDLVDVREKLQRIWGEGLSPLIAFTTQRKNKLFLPMGSQSVGDVRPTRLRAHSGFHLVEEDVRPKDVRYQINTQRKADGTRAGLTWASIQAIKPRHVTAAPGNGQSARAG